MRNVKLAPALLEKEAEEAAEKWVTEKRGRLGVARQDLALGLGVAQRTNSEQGRTVPVPAGVAGRQAERCDAGVGEGGVGDRMTMGNKR